MLICLLGGCAAAENEEETVNIPWPEELQVTIAWEEWTAEDGRVCDVAVPVTCREDVNAQLRSTQEELWAETLAHAEAEDDVEMMATYRISGESWAGFLLTGRVIREIDIPRASDQDQTMYLCYRVFSYDMKTGAALTLADVFAADSSAWEQAAETIETALTAYYAEEAHDAEFIRAACEQQHLSAMPFMPGAGRLVIAFPLWQVIENRYQLVNVSLYYPDYRPMMTEAALAQTDNSHRPIVAVTYDDGPSLFYTPKIRRHLATYGASATFFVLARHMVGLADGVRSALDYMHDVGSHTYEHKYEFSRTITQLREDRVLCQDLHRELLGIAPTLFRAPGGHCEKYVSAEVGWPIILWSYSAGDTGNNTAPQLARRIIEGSENGDILLMHDIKEKTAVGSETFLREMTQRGFMFATVEELLTLHGVEILPNKVYHSAFEHE